MVVDIRRRRLRNQCVRTVRHIDHLERFELERMEARQKGGNLSYQEYLDSLALKRRRMSSGVCVESKDEK